MIEEASLAIDRVRERDRRVSQAKYWRRNTMRYIDQLLNELEMLNLADRSDVPTPISTAVDKLIGEVDVSSLAAAAAHKCRGDDGSAVRDPGRPDVQPDRGRVAGHCPRPGFGSGFFVFKSSLFELLTIACDPLTTIALR